MSCTVSCSVLADSLFQLQKHKQTFTKVIQSLTDVWWPAGQSGYTPPRSSAGWRLKTADGSLSPLLNQTSLLPSWILTTIDVSASSEWRKIKPIRQLVSWSAETKQQEVEHSINETREQRTVAAMKYNTKQAWSLWCDRDMWCWFGIWVLIIIIHK